MKFQDDISMPHTCTHARTHAHTHGQAETNMSPTFSKLGAQKLKFKVMLRITVLNSVNMEGF